jgi:sugar/nucleoside kinase (ribokinase family)
MTYDLLVVGRPCCDLIFTGLPTWPQPGRESYASDVFMTVGGAFNAAAAASRLGLQVGFIGILGSDRWSEFILEHFAAEGLSTELLRILDRPLPALSVALNCNGDRGFVTHEAETDVVDQELFSYAARVVEATPARHVHVHLVCGLPEIAAAARRRGMSITADAWGWEPWLCSGEVRAIMPLTDVLLTNEPEAQLLAGTTDTQQALASLAELTPYVVVKRGEAGAVAAVGGQALEAPTHPVDVIDATGAGDCFNAGFIYGWLRGLEPRACLALGNLCGGRAVQALGGYQGCPTEAELLAGADGAGVAGGALKRAPEA